MTDTMRVYLALADKHQWTYLGRELMVRTNTIGAYVAYVEATSEEIVGADNIDAHGGITFTGSMEYPDGAARLCMGMDFAHAYDYVPGLAIPQPNTHRWTMDEVRSQAEYVADQLGPYHG